MTSPLQYAIPSPYDNEEEDWYGEESEPVKPMNRSITPTDIDKIARSVYHFARFEKPSHSPGDEEFERTFQTLKDKWQRDTMFVSSTTEMIYNVNYQQIIGLGPNVIPLLLRDLAETHKHWFWALRMISRHNPVKDEDAGNIGIMVESWLEWGRREGYL